MRPPPHTPQFRKHRAPPLILTSRLPAGFTKVSFLPLLDFAYTSALTFNFCVMADIANLARHLLMTEVLQICESVHKQVEEQKLTVYQRGDVHTVVSSQPAAQDGPKDEPAAFVVTIESDGRALVTQSGEPVAFLPAPEEADGQQPVTVVAEAQRREAVTLIAHEPGETLTLISGGSEGDTMTVVTHSGQAGASESLAVVSACLAMEEQQQQQQPAPGSDAAVFVINVDTDKSSPSEVVKLSSQASATPSETAEAAAVPQKRKRGRPAKVKREVEVYVPLEEEEQPSADEGHGDKQDASDDPKRRRLRQRSIAEGGYARLHMGLEEEEEEGGKKGATSPRNAASKVRLHV